MQVQQSLSLMRQAFVTLFRPPGQAQNQTEGTTFRPTVPVDDVKSSAPTRGPADNQVADFGPSLRKGSAMLPKGVMGFIAERIYMPESTIGLPRGYFIDISV
jgi:hypothetical protein